jgi:hypothetical protein
MKRGVLVGISILGMLGPAACSDDHPPEPTGAVVGAVYDADTGEPMVGAELFIGERQAWTAADGTFRMEAVPVGSQALKAQYFQYNEWWEIVEVRAFEEIPVDIRLSPRARLSITFRSPASAPVGESLTVAVNLSSPYSITRATAQVEGEVTDLLYGPSGRDNAWLGDLSLAAYTSPSDRAVVIRAWNGNGDSARASVAFRFDRRPTLTVVTPTGDAVATPSLRVTATCTDDDPAGCAEVIVFSGSTLARAEGGSLDEDVSFAQLPGQARSVIIGGRDRAGQLDSVVRTVFVEAGATLTRVAEGGPGTIVDATADRLLVINSAGDADTVTIVDRAGGSRTVVYVPDTAALRVPQEAAALVAGGALFVIGPWTRESLYEWRSGALTTLSPNVAYASFVAVGDYAIWNAGNTLYRRDLVAGLTVDIATTSSDDNDVAANGDVVFTSGGAVQRWRSGAIATVGSGYAPVTDGANVAYARGPVLTGPFTIAMFDGVTEAVLASNQYYQPVHASHYLARNGWVAFTREDLTRIRQGWVRSPAGVLRQVGFFGGHNWIEDIGPDGTVVFFVDGGLRYRAPPGGSTVEIGSRLGRAKYIDGQLHVLIGPTLFRVN